MNGKAYKMVLISAMMCGLEMVALTKKTGGRGGRGRTEVSLLGTKRMDKIRNEYTRGTAQIKRLRFKVRQG